MEIMLLTETLEQAAPLVGGGATLGALIAGGMRWAFGMLGKKADVLIAEFQGMRSDLQENTIATKERNKLAIEHDSKQTLILEGQKELLEKLKKEAA